MGDLPDQETLGTPVEKEETMRAAAERVRTHLGEMVRVGNADLKTTNPAAVPSARSYSEKTEESCPKDMSQHG